MESSAIVGNFARCESECPQACGREKERRCRNTPRALENVHEQQSTDAAAPGNDGSLIIAGFAQVKPFFSSLVCCCCGTEKNIVSKSFCVGFCHPSFGLCRLSAYTAY